MWKTWHIIKDDGHLSNWQVEEWGLTVSSLNKKSLLCLYSRSCTVHHQAQKPWLIHICLHLQLGKLRQNLTTMANKLQLIFRLTDPNMASYLVLIGPKQCQIPRASSKWQSDDMVNRWYLWLWLCLRVRLCCLLLLLSSYICITMRWHSHMLPLPLHVWDMGSSFCARHLKKTKNYY